MTNGQQAEGKQRGSTEANFQGPDHGGAGGSISARAEVDWQSFMRDGFEYEQHQGKGVTAATGAGGQHAPAADFAGLQRLSSAEIEKILALDTNALDLGNPLPDMFGGEEGNELLGLDFFPELLSPNHAHRAETREAQQQLAEQEQQPAPAPREGPGSMADAARSVLATLGPLPGSPVQIRDAPIDAMQPRPSETATPQRAPRPLGQFQAALPDHSAYSPPPGYVLAGGPVFVDAATGQIIQPAAPFLAPHWGSSMGGPSQVAAMPGQPLPQFYSHPQQYQQHYHHQQQVQYVVQQQQQQLHPASPGMRMAYAPGVVLAPAPMPDPPSPKKSPPKRRRSSKTNMTSETLAQQCAKAEQGYTYDPASGRLYRHGPALMASAKDNKELPVIKSLFDTFHQHHGFAAGAPPPGYASPHVQPGQQQQQQQGALSPEQVPLLAAAGNGSGGPYVSQHHPGQLLDGGRYPQPQYLMQQHPQQHAQFSASCAVMVPQAQGQPTQSQPGQRQQAQQQRSGSPMATNSPGPSTSSSHLLNPEPHQGAVPSGRQLSQRTGHGFITSLVTRELRSSTPRAPTSTGPAGDEGQGDGSGGGRMLGVARDRFSLFWDAFVEPASPGSASPRPPPASTSILQGFKQEALYLGKFPTRDQAGRAHDIAALKLHGDAAVTNFPIEAYAATLPMLAAHSGEEVVAALQKDSELALHRTSRYKGVRRTGAGQYEARAEVDDILPAAADMSQGAGK